MKTQSLGGGGLGRVLDGSGPCGEQSAPRGGNPVRFQTTGDLADFPGWKNLLSIAIRRAIDGLLFGGDKRSMNRELIRQQLVGRGPFLIRTSDGKEFPVPHPEFILIGRHNIVIEDSKGLLDIIDPLHVVSIRPSTRRKTHKAAV